MNEQGIKMNIRSSNILVILLLHCFVATAVIGYPKLGYADSRGEGINVQLHRHRVLDSYMSDLVSEIARTLVTVSGRWSGAQVNGQYRSNYINIYLVNGDLLPNRSILSEFGINHLSNRRFANASVDEASKSIFIDTRLLKNFLSYEMLKEQQVDGLQAAAFIKVKGLYKLRDLWDPNRNSQLHSRRYRDIWLIAFRGMMALVIAHEMGHITIGPTHINYDDPLVFNNKQDRDTRWACPGLIDPSYLQKQQIERQADDYATSLLSKVVFPDNIQPKRFLYELGAHAYLSYQLKNELLGALQVTASPNIHRIMRYQLGSNLYNALLSSNSTRDRGSVHVFFPKTHPATVYRSMNSLKKLTNSPYSSFYGEGLGIESEFIFLRQIIDSECQRLQSR
jgi:hypothetical protein